MGERWGGGDARWWFTICEDICDICLEEEDGGGMNFPPVAEGEGPMEEKEEERLVVAEGAMKALEDLITPAAEIAEGGGLE